MPTLYAVPPGLPIADIAAAHILAQMNDGERARSVILVPTRRAAVTMRQALQGALKGAASLLPRIVPLADIDNTLLSLLGVRALDLLETIPPAMPDWQQRYLLTAQVGSFLKARKGIASLDYALALAEELMALQQQCARAGVTLTREKLEALVAKNMAEHWEESLAFLTILAETWPSIEAAMGMTIAPNNEHAVLHVLADAWRTQAPDFHVFVVGSTASQESTAQLLEVIANLPMGEIILPGLDVTMPEAEWASITAGHPLFHVKAFLDRFPLTLTQVTPLAEAARMVWLDALAATETIPQWQAGEIPSYAHLKLIPCAHAEAEARVIALLMREALETPDKRTALVTPDEGLMERVAAHMKRYGVTIDRLERGTLATSDSGSLWVALMALLNAPESLLHLRSLLHHRLFTVDPHFLTMLEPYWYGMSTTRAGQMPKLPSAVRAHDAYPALEKFVRALHAVHRDVLLPSAWIAACEAFLQPWVAVEGAAADAVQDILETLAEADVLGPMSLREFTGLLDERLRQPSRHGGVRAHPQIAMLTPVEARLQQFDRVILGTMTEAVWPGLTPVNAWLNLAAQAELGLPSPAHQVSLAAHDVMMLGSAPEVFLTYPLRDQGSPATRSRFIERLVTLLAMHGVKEKSITAAHYTEWADMLYAAAEFAPSTPVEPRPAEEQRPTKLPVSALDTLFSDPFAVYARHVLGLKELKEIDADPEASDFGSLAHEAILLLTEHWNANGRPATEQEIAAMADAALRDFSDRPSTALFWRTRLLRSLEFVDAQEAVRRTEPALQVRPEVEVEASLGALTLHGRVDRLEEDGNGIVIGDYKTGEISSKGQILDGRATQLLAYMLLIDMEAGQTDATLTQAIEYWRLPHGRHAGKLLSVTRDELLEQELPDRLVEALQLMREPTTPFLANPSRFGHIYDGISRYDEWSE